MRRLLKIIDNLARLIAVIDIGKEISEHLASKKDTTKDQQAKKWNRKLNRRGAWSVKPVGCSVFHPYGIIATLRQKTLILWGFICCEEKRCYFCSTWKKLYSSQWIKNEEIGHSVYMSVGGDVFVAKGSCYRTVGQWFHLLTIKLWDCILYYLQYCCADKFALLSRRPSSGTAKWQLDGTLVTSLSVQQPINQWISVCPTIP